MTDLKDLIARCERTTGGDREIDGTLWWLLYLAEEQRDQYDHFGGVATAAKQYGSYGAALGQFFDSSNPYCLARVAFKMQFTSSIDAALALCERVLPGAMWIKPFMDQNSVRLYKAIGDFPAGEASAPTLPLAIVLATLKALEKDSAE